MKEIAGKFFNRSQKTDRGDYEEGSVAKFQDYDSNKIPRGGFGNKAKVALLGLMALGLSGCALDLLPRFAQPRIWSDYKDEEVRDEQRSHGEVVTSGKRKLLKKYEEPMFFNAAKETEIGYEDKRDIFYPDEKIWVVAKPDIEGKITNFVLALDKNEQIPEDLVKGSDKIKIVLKGHLIRGGSAYGKFDASYLLENYGNNFRTYWLHNDKIIGSRDFVIMDKRPARYSSK